MLTYFILVAICSLIVGGFIGWAIKPKTRIIKSYTNILSVDTNSGWSTSKTLVGLDAAQIDAKAINGDWQTVIGAFCLVLACLGLGGCSALFTAGGQPTILTTDLVAGSSAVATSRALKPLSPARQQADAILLNQVADAVIAANATPPNFDGLKTLATNALLKANNPEYALLLPLIQDAITEAQQQAASQMSTVQTVAAQGLVTAAMRGVKIGASLYLPTPPASQP